MRKAKIVQKAKDDNNKRLAIEGRTKAQRKKIVMKNAINTHDDRLGELKGETIKERYAMMHRLIAHFNAIARKEAEAAKQE
mgnify:CR=1 FL=1